MSGEISLREVKSLRDEICYTGERLIGFNFIRVYTDFTVSKTPVFLLRNSSLADRVCDYGLLFCRL